MRKRDYDRSKKDVKELAYLLDGAAYNRYEAVITAGPGPRESEREWLGVAVKIARRLCRRLEEHTDA